MRKPGRYRAGPGLMLLALSLLATSCGGPASVPVGDVDSRYAESKVAPGYTGADGCRPCHPQAYVTWASSSHGRGMERATPEAVVGDFTTETLHRFRGFSARMTRAGEEFYVVLYEADQPPDTSRVDLVIGTRQMQGYLTRMPDGRYQELPVVVQRSTGNWVEASSGGTLPTDVQFGDTDWYYWKNPGRAWNFKCYNCHASQIQKGYDQETDTYNTAWVDLSINCETCHGPGADHVRFWNDRIQGSVVDSSPDTTLVRLASLAPDRSVDVCIQCHALKNIADTGFLPGDDFNDFYDPVLWDNAAVTWPDGLFRGDAYTYIGYLKNRCYVVGGMTCTHCHDSHGSSHPNDLIASPDESDRFCASCHPDYTSDPQLHTHHRRDGLGGRCIGCHMPSFTPAEFIAEGMRLTDHRLVSPVPEATERFGIPNACAQAGCHADKPSAWANEWSRTWYGGYQDRFVRETTAVQDGLAGNPRAVAPLQEMLLDPARVPAVRATAAALLGNFPLASVADGLATALEDPSPLVRSRAATSLRRHRNPDVGLFLETAVGDSNTFVRTSAALAMLALGAPASDDEVKAQLDRTYRDYQDLLNNLWADDPQSHVVRGDLFQREGDGDSAADAYRTSLKIWRHNPEALLRLAHLEQGLGNLPEAGSLAREALQLHPGLPGAIALLSDLYGPTLQRLEGQASSPDASWQAFFDLGSLYAELARFEEAAQSFQKAVRRDPSKPGAYRELGLALANRGRHAEAIAAFEHYLSLAIDASDAPQIRDLLKQLRTP